MIDAPTDAPNAPAVGTERRIPRDRLWATVIAVALVVPMVAGIVLTLTGHVHYRPGFDNALMELRVRDALHHAVFTGPYSRYGWYHPGPMLFYVDSIAYRLSGESALALPITALALNALAVVGVVGIAFRVGRLRAVLWIALPTALLVHTLGADFLRSPWNPDVSLLMFELFLMAAWALAVGRRGSVLLMVIVGSFVVQNHVGFVLPVLAIAAAAVGVRMFERRAEGDPAVGHGTRRGVLTVVGAAVVLWVLPVYGDLVAGDANLRNVAKFALTGGTSTHEARVGGLTALRIVGAQLGPHPVWALVARTDLPFNGTLSYSETRWWLPVLGVLALGGLVVAFWRRERSVLGFGVLIAVGFVVAVVSVASMRGLTYAYLTQWQGVLGVGLGALVLAGVTLAVAPARRSVAFGVLLAVTLGGVVTVDASLVRAGARDRTPSDTVALTAGEQQSMLRAIGPPTIAAVAPRQGPVVLDTTYGVLESPGLALELERAGIPVRIVGRDHSVPYGPDRRWACGPFRARIGVYSGDDNAKRDRPTWPEVAHWTEPYTTKERQALGLVQLGWVRRPPSPARTKTLRRLARQLNGPKYDVAVYVSPAGRAACPT